MAFPLTRRASVNIDTPLDPSQAAHRLAAVLERERASRVRIHEASVHFRVKLFRIASRRNILDPVDGGVFRVTGRAGALVIRYTLSFRRLLIISIGVLVFAAIAVASAPALPRAGRIGLVAIVWCVHFIGNYLFSCLRFPRFIRRAVAHGPNP